MGKHEDNVDNEATFKVKETGKVKANNSRLRIPRYLDKDSPYKPGKYSPRDKV